MSIRSLFTVTGISAVIFSSLIYPTILWNAFSSVLLWASLITAIIIAISFNGRSVQRSIAYSTGILIVFCLLHTNSFSIVGKFNFYCFESEKLLNQLRPRTQNQLYTTSLNFPSIARNWTLMFIGCCTVLFWEIRLRLMTKNGTDNKAMDTKPRRGQNW